MSTYFPVILIYGKFPVNVGLLSALPTSFLLNEPVPTPFDSQIVTFFPLKIYLVLLILLLSASIFAEVQSDFICYLTLIYLLASLRLQ